MIKKFYKTKALLLLAALFSFGAAFAETGSETEQNATGGGTSNAQVDGQSYYVAGTYIAGGGSAQTGDMTSKGFKLRTGQDGKRVVFTVNPNYTIKNFSLTGASNYELNEGGEKEVSVIKVEVDGVEVEFTGGEAFKYRGGGESCTLSVPNISATQTIAIYFDNGDSKGSQINACWAIDWERPDATQPTITVTPAAMKLVPGATCQLSAKVDPNKFTTKWISDNEAVATVSETGLVTAVAPGTANISNAWTDDVTVAGTAVITVADFNPADYKLVKEWDFTAMGDVTLTIESDACGAIWNEGNNKPNNVFYCTNEGLEDIAVQAVLSSNKGWSIVDGKGLVLGSGAGRCAAVGHLTAGQVVEIIYTGNGFYTGNHDDAVRKDDGALKTPLSEGVGRAIYKMDEDGLLGFELIKGNAVEKITVYEGDAIATEVTIDMSTAIADEAGYLKSFSSTYDLDFSAVEGIKAYVGTKNFDSWGAVESVTLKSIDVVPAGTGVVLKAEAGATYTVPMAESVPNEAFENELLAAETDVDLNEAVVTDYYGDFVSGPAILLRGKVVTGIDWDTYQYIYDDATGFFPANPISNELKAGEAYLPIAEGEWDVYSYDYLKLIFTDQDVPVYNSIGELAALPLTDSDNGAVDACLNFQNTADVTWTNGAYMAVEDNTGGLIMQVPEGISVKAGDILSGSFTGYYSNILLQQLVASPMTKPGTLTVTEGSGEPTPAEVTLEQAFDESNVMRLVKLTGLQTRIVEGYYSNDYYIMDQNGTEVYLNDSFGVVADDIEAGTTIEELVGLAYIIPDGSPYLSYGYEKYEFLPVSVSGVTTGIADLSQQKSKAPVYTLQGVRVSNVKKGLYIQNGKKYVQK